eukprot:gnl/TRDRNA2_/TRDRNA2_152544_c0_seq1.p2 gnl/TRDRNA2_/TRDRNA2_152544_c0~~gnl/TRDRNA2_/TRDRNA2_152544_c0_seq1.p2  ORF type:complete len:108 (-),score=16.56 gnl/TRDRNA2_/TRDRNA2_152544_c0_seq1:25-348(-)
MVPHVANIQYTKLCFFTIFNSGPRNVRTVKGTKKTGGSKITPAVILPVGKSESPNFATRPVARRPAAQKQLCIAKSMARVKYQAHATNANSTPKSMQVASESLKFLE